MTVDRSPDLARTTLQLLALGALIATSKGLNDYQGRPLGTDFSNIYAGGTYVLDGKAGFAFDPPAQHEEGDARPDRPRAVQPLDARRRAQRRPSPRSPIRPRSVPGSPSPQFSSRRFLRRPAPRRGTLAAAADAWT